LFGQTADGDTFPEPLASRPWDNQPKEHRMRAKQAPPSPCPILQGEPTVVLSPQNVYPAGEYELVLFWVFQLTAALAAFRVKEGVVAPSIVNRDPCARARYRLCFLLRVQKLPAGGAARFRLRAGPEALRAVDVRTTEKVTLSFDVTLEPGGSNSFPLSPDGPLDWNFYSCAITRLA
jgi:hypothetical protein